MRIPTLQEIKEALDERDKIKPFPFPIIDYQDILMPEKEIDEAKLTKHWDNLKEICKSTKTNIIIQKEK